LPSASDEQGHLVAALQCTLLRSSAQAYLSEVAAAYPLIQEAARASAFKGLLVPPKADLADFQTSALTEAATAMDFNGQACGSCRPQLRPGHLMQVLAALGRWPSKLEDGFDLCASRLIEDGLVRISRSPEDMALGVLPLLPLALHL